MKIGLFSKAVLLVAVIALGNAFIVQPAMEIQKKHIASHAQENNGDESQCCFICHPSHHQWVAPTWPGGATRLVSTEPYLHKTSDLHSDPPIGSIFHPPHLV